MKKTVIAIMVAFLGAPVSFADEKYDHFPSLDAPDVKTAYCNLAEFNEKLSAIVNKPELSAEDMVKVHELTYTLENAVIRLQTTLKDLAADLEEVHLASETLNSKTVKGSGELYLSAINSIMTEAACK